MTRNVLSATEAAELTRLYDEYATATVRAAAVLRSHGMDSSEFLEADSAAGEIVRQIRAILGIAGKHWMA